MNDVNKDACKHKNNYSPQLVESMMNDELREMDEMMKMIIGIQVCLITMPEFHNIQYLEGRLMGDNGGKRR